MCGRRRSESVRSNGAWRSRHGSCRRVRRRGLDDDGRRDGRGDVTGAVDNVCGGQAPVGYVDRPAHRRLRSIDPEMHAHAENDKGRSLDEPDPIRSGRKRRTVGVRGFGTRGFNLLYCRRFGSIHMPIGRSTAAVQAIRAPITRSERGWRARHSLCVGPRTPSCACPEWRQTMQE
jgi:hypothetical protein